MDGDDKQYCNGLGLCLKRSKEPSDLDRTILDAIEASPPAPPTDINDGKTYWSPKEHPLSTRLRDCANDVMALRSSDEVAKLYVLLGCLASLAIQAVPQLRKVEEEADARFLNGQ